MSHFYLNTMTDSVKNVFKNIVAPLVRDNHTTFGLFIDVTLESIISWTIRYLVGEKMGFFEIFTTVFLATPLIGFGGMAEVSTKDKQGKEVGDTSYAVRFLLGLQTVPSIFMAQYIQGTVSQGFYMPKFRIWPILTTIISRTLSRVIIMTLMLNDAPGHTYWKTYMDFQDKQIKESFFAKTEPAKPA